MAQPKPHRSSAFDRCNVKDEVKLAMQESFHSVEVYKVTSGDSGKDYFIQVIKSTAPIPGKPKDWIYLCDCYAGKFIQPAEILGLGHDLRCKHVKDLLEVIE